MILGTAGHIDHGKTALVRALTGVDTDRLPEEKRRGITIDLGFAPFVLDDGTTLGVVDVPGHEAFVRTMVAGATGIDLALLVIAADEGPMPQTREHLAILELLEVRGVIVALTKCDLVDAEWRTLVTEEVAELLRDTRFRNARIIPASVVGEPGVGALRDAIASVAREAHGARAAVSSSPFRLPIDRAFTMRGTGVVVTGTVWSGELASDSVVRIMPTGSSARVRGLQRHGASVSTIAAGTRAAVALAGVDLEAVSRSATLITAPAWHATTVLRADVTLLPDAPELRPRTKVRFHLATADVGARVVAAGTPVRGGATRPVRVVLDEPVLARGGDRFVLRSASPLATIGGGVVMDAFAPRRARPMSTTGLDTASRLRLIVEETGAHGVDSEEAAFRVGAGTDTVAAGDPAIVRIGNRLYGAIMLAGLRARILELVAAHHKQKPLDPGAPRQDVRSRLGVDLAVFDHLVNEASRSGDIVAAGADLRAREFGSELTPAQQKVSEEIVQALSASSNEPPSVAELQQRFGAQTMSLLKYLERQGRVVQVEETRYYTVDALRALLLRLEGAMSGRGELAPTDLREALGFSRKFLIPFLEYCDRRGYTARHGNGRVWRGGTERRQS